MAGSETIIIEIVSRAETRGLDEMSRALKGIEQNYKAFGQSVSKTGQQMNQTMSSAGKTMEQAGRQAQQAQKGFDWSAQISRTSTAIGQSARQIASFVASSVKDLRDMSDAFQATTGATVEETKNVEDAVVRLFKTQDDSMQDLFGVFTKLRQEMGLNAAEAEKVAESYLNFTQVVGGNTSAAITQINNVLKAFNLTAEDAARVTDVVTFAQQKWGGSASQMIGILGRMAPSLQAANLQMEDGVAVLGLFQKAGLNAAQAPRALMMAINKVKSPEQLLKLFDDISKIESAQERTAAASKVFGSRMGQQLANALKPGAEGVSDLRQQLAGASGTVEKAVATIESRFGYQFQQTLKAAKGALIDFGREWGSTFQVLGTVAPAAGKLIQGLGLGPLIAEATKTLTTGMKNAGSQAVSSMIEGVEVATGAAGTIVGNILGRMFDPTEQTGYIAKIGAGLLRAKGAVTAAGAALGAVFSTAFNTAAMVGDKAFAAFNAFFRGLPARLGGVVTAAGAALGTIFGGAFAVAMTAVQSAGQRFLAGLQALLGGGAGLAAAKAAGTATGVAMAEGQTAAAAAAMAAGQKVIYAEVSVVGTPAAAAAGAAAGRAYAEGYTLQAGLLVPAGAAAAQAKAGAVAGGESLLAGGAAGGGAVATKAGGMLGGLVGKAFSIAMKGFIILTIADIAMQVSPMLNKLAKDIQKALSLDKFPPLQWLGDGMRDFQRTSNSIIADWMPTFVEDLIRPFEDFLDIVGETPEVLKGSINAETGMIDKLGESAKAAGTDLTGLADSEELAAEAAAEAAAKMDLLSEAVLRRMAANESLMAGYNQQQELFEGIGVGLPPPPGPARPPVVGDTGQEVERQDAAASMAGRVAEAQRQFWAEQHAREEEEQRKHNERMAEIAAQLPGAIASRMQERRDDPLNAFKQMLEGLKNPITATKEFLGLSGMLMSDELAKGLKSGDPVLRREAEAARDAIIKRIEQIGPRAGVASKETIKLLKEGMKSDDAGIRAASTAAYNAVMSGPNKAEKEAKGKGTKVATNFKSGIEGKGLQKLGVGAEAGGTVASSHPLTQPTDAAMSDMQSKASSYAQATGSVYAANLASDANRAAVRRAAKALMAPLEDELKPGSPPKAYPDIDKHAKKTGADYMQDITRGAEQEAPAAGKKIGKSVKKVTDEADKESKKIGKQTGRDYAAALALGVVEKTKDLEAKKAIAAQYDEIRYLLTGTGYDAGEALAEGIKLGAIDKRHLSLDAIQSYAETVKGATNLLKGTGYTIGEAVGLSIALGLSSKEDDVGEAVGRLAELLKAPALSTALTQGLFDMFPRAPAPEPGRDPAEDARRFQEIGLNLQELDLQRQRNALALTPQMEKQNAAQIKILDAQLKSINSQQTAIGQEREKARLLQEQLDLTKAINDAANPPGPTPLSPLDRRTKELEIARQQTALQTMVDPAERLATLIQIGLDRAVLAATPKIEGPQVAAIDKLFKYVDNLDRALRSETDPAKRRELEGQIFTYLQRIDTLNQQLIKENDPANTANVEAIAAGVAAGVVKTAGAAGAGLAGKQTMDIHVTGASASNVLPPGTVIAGANPAEIAKIAQTGFAGAQQELQTHIDIIEAKWKDANLEVIQMLNDFAQDYQAAGRTVGDAFAKGIESAKTAVTKSASELAKIVADYLRVASPAKKGPLHEDQRKWGAAMVRTWVAGAVAELKKAGVNLEGALERWMGPVFDWMSGGGGGGWGGWGGWSGRPGGPGAGPGGGPGGGPGALTAGPWPGPGSTVGTHDVAQGVFTPQSTPERFQSVALQRKRNYRVAGYTIGPDGEWGWLPPGVTDVSNEGTPAGYRDLEEAYTLPSYTYNPAGRSSAPDIEAMNRYSDDFYQGLKGENPTNEQVQQFQAGLDRLAMNLAPYERPTGRPGEVMDMRTGQIRQVGYVYGYGDFSMSNIRKTDALGNDLGTYTWNQQPEFAGMYGGGVSSGAYAWNQPTYGGTGWVGGGTQPWAQAQPVEPPTENVFDMRGSMFLGNEGEADRFARWINERIQRQRARQTGATVAA